MEDKLALRLAATAGEDLRVDQAKAVIDEYLLRLAKCPVCNGSGDFTFGQKTAVKAEDRHGNAVAGGVTVPAGTDSRCPLCGDGSGDPKFVGWHCLRGDDDYRCQRAKERRDTSDGDHSACGNRLILKLPSEDRGEPSE